MAILVSETNSVKSDGPQTLTLVTYYVAPYSNKIHPHS